MAVKSTVSVLYCDSEQFQFRRGTASDPNAVSGKVPWVQYRVQWLLRVLCQCCIEQGRIREGPLGAVQGAVAAKCTVSSKGGVQ